MLQMDNQVPPPFGVIFLALIVMLMFSEVTDCRKRGLS